MKFLAARYVLPMSPGSEGPIENGGVVVDDDGKIEAVGSKDGLLAAQPELKGVETEDFPGAVLMPGLVNAHTHLDLIHYDYDSERRKVPFRGERSDQDIPDGGLGESGITPNFFDRLVGGWNHRKTLTPSDRRHCLEDGIRQLLRSGITCVGDTGQYVGVIAQMVNSPMRMVLFPELLNGGEAGITESYEAAFSQVDEILDSKSPRIAAGIAPYAAYTLSRHLLKIVAQQARAMRIPLKIHVAETFSEMQFFYESNGEIADKLFPQMGWEGQLPPEHRKTPIQYLESIGFLDDGPTLIGCNHLAEPDLQTLARTRAKIVHSPRANAHLKLGHPPLKKLRELKVPVALGTDGTGSLHSLSVWDEMRYIQNHYPEGDQPSAKDLLAMATREGARALGLDDRVGSLETGKEADLIAVRVPKETAAAGLIERLVAHTTEREIAAVYIEGKRIKF